MKTVFYRFSPDFRRRAPNMPQAYCAHCQKPVDAMTAIPVTIDWDNWIFAEGHNNPAVKSTTLDEEAYFGSTCYKKMWKEKIS